MSKQFLSICRCPIHQEYWALSLDNEDGCGHRLTPSKCCGRWREVTRWRITPELTREVLEQFTKCLDAERERGGA